MSVRWSPSVWGATGVRGGEGWPGRGHAEGKGRARFHLGCILAGFLQMNRLVVKMGSAPHSPAHSCTWPVSGSSD